MNNEETFFDLRIGGMTCGHCVRSAKEALQRVPGVRDAEVDLETGNARVWYSGPTTVAELQAEIEAEGFTAFER